jgi:hypothetical protein
MWMECPINDAALSQSVVKLSWDITESSREEPALAHSTLTLESAQQIAETLTEDLRSIIQIENLTVNIEWPIQEGNTMNISARIWDETIYSAQADPRFMMKSPRIFAASIIPAIESSECS